MDVNRLVGGDWDYLHCPAVGNSGGLLALWKKDVMKFEVMATDEQVLIGKVLLPNLQEWIVAVVYAKKDYHACRSLWNVIGNFINGNLPVIVGGDFNCCLDQSEKKGGQKYKYTVGAQEMSAFLVDNDLHDLVILGPRYTWSNNKTGNSKIWVRLDRILMNSEGLRLAPLVTVKHLVRLASDHYPLLLFLAPTLQKPEGRWLRFEDIWMSYPVTWKIVWKNWTKQDYGLPADVLNGKCHRTLRALFFWSRNRLKELGELKNLL
ncbi:uncharacterized protein LOC110112018 [Dendrobium catenatum]|uniref:uncharacterized protein LOC110112018 n=1 Tax=Dendrobium catenatum TaxID=906689 RepID=UPI0009F2E6AD|nr:uncharacterized protein LOC110112018 [Dendrobium catenatum]